MKNFLFLIAILLLSGCVNPVTETEISSIQTETPSLNTSTPTLEPTPTITLSLTLSPTFTSTPTLTFTPTPIPVDLYNRLNWQEFYNAIPKEWGWDWLVDDCNDQIMASLVSEDPDLCTTTVEPRSDLETGKYFITIAVLDYHKNPYTFVEFIPYLYKGSLGEDESLADFPMNQHFYFKNIFNEVAEYCKESYSGEYSIYGVFYRELTEKEWDYLVTKIPSWDVAIKGPAGTDKTFP